VQRPARRSPRTRLVLTLAALASVIAGYYAGQYWQRRPLDGLAAVVYPAGDPIEFPAGLGLDAPDAPPLWRLFLVADTRAPQCRELLQHYAGVVNRLAAWPKIQERLRLTVLAYDRPDAAAITAFSNAVGWIEVISAEPAVLDRLSGQLGLLPTTGDWCGRDQAGSILVAPDHEAWALVPFGEAAIMAHDIRTIIDFVE
jgi:hypothetical protein